MKHKLSTICAMAFAMASLAGTLPGFDDADLGTITCAWKFSYTDSEETDNMWCILALAGKAAAGAVMPAATGDRDIRQVDVQVQNSGWAYRRAQSYAYSETVLMGAGYTWTLRVTATDSDGNTRTDSQALMLAPLSGYASAIPAGALFTLKDSAGNVVKEAIDPSKNTTLSLTPGNYALQFAINTKAVSLNLTIVRGWNLVGIPLARVTNAAGLLKECIIFDPANDNSRVTDAVNLSAGAAYWVYRNAEGTKNYTIDGVASTSQKSHLPELGCDWNFACPVAQSDDQGTLVLCDVPAGEQWDAVSERFVDASSGKAVAGKGYVLKNGE